MCFLFIWSLDGYFIFPEPGNLMLRCFRSTFRRILVVFCVEWRNLTLRLTSLPGRGNGKCFIFLLIELNSCLQPVVFVVIGLCHSATTSMTLVAGSILTRGHSTEWKLFLLLFPTILAIQHASAKANNGERRILTIRSLCLSCYAVKKIETDYFLQLNLP